MQALAEGYVAARKYSGIEWHVDVAGEVLTAGQAGYADAHAGTAIPDEHGHKPIVQSCEWDPASSLRLGTWRKRCDNTIAVTKTKWIVTVQE